MHCKFCCTSAKMKIKLAYWAATRAASVAACSHSIPSGRYRKQLSFVHFFKPPNQKESTYILVTHSGHRLNILSVTKQGKKVENIWSLAPSESRHLAAFGTVSKRAITFSQWQFCWLHTFIQESAMDHGTLGLSFSKLGDESWFTLNSNYIRSIR